MLRIIKLFKASIRSKILKAILGQNATIFVKEKSPTIYEIEVADGRNRVKLANLTVKKVTDIRYQVVNHQSS